MRGFGMIPADLIAPFEKALAEDRLGWRVTDQHGRPCNGGKAEPLAIGEWSEAIDDALICLRGWHLTMAPHRWRGARVWLCEGEGKGRGDEVDSAKTVWRRIRPLAEVDPGKCLDAQVHVRCAPHLKGADLEGASLEGADLEGANLKGASLEGASLEGASLEGADLEEASLKWASLEGANLEGASLEWANLKRASLKGASLEGASLEGASLEGADLEGASLKWASLGSLDPEDLRAKGAIL